MDLKQLKLRINKEKKQQRNFRRKIALMLVLAVLSIGVILSVQFGFAEGTVEIIGVSMTPEVFSPNGDQVNDQVALNYSLNVAATVTFSVYDQTAEVKRTIISNQSAGQNQITWDGKDDSGNLLPDGGYNFQIDAIDEQGKRAASINGMVVIDITEPILSSVADSPDPFMSNGANLNDIEYTLNEASNVTIDVYRHSNGDHVRTLVNNSYRTAGKNAAHWDGKDDLLDLVADGQYDYKIQAKDIAGNEAIIDGSITIEINAPFIIGQSANPEVFSPNGDGLKDSTQVSLFLSEPSVVWLTVYNNAHTATKVLVDGITYPAGVNSFEWSGVNDLGNLVPDGAYTLEIRAEDMAGNLSNLTKTLVEVDTFVGTASNLGALDQTDKVNLTWYLTDIDISQFKIYRSTVSNFTPSDQLNLLATVTGDQKFYLDTSHREEAIYFYKIRAIDYAGNDSVSTLVVASPVDSASPVVESVQVINNRTFLINFNEKLRYIPGVDESVYSPANYSIFPSLGSITPFLFPNGTTVKLVTENMQSPGVYYTVYVNPSVEPIIIQGLDSPFLKDYSGNTLEANSTFGAESFNPHGPYSNDTEMCGQCHSSHSATGDFNIVKANVNELCYSCHDGSQSSINIQAQFTDPEKAIKHPVTEGVMNCDDCHNPHGNKNIDLGPNQVYPKLLRSRVGSTEYYNQNQFCLACHGNIDQNAVYGRFTSGYWDRTGGNHNNPLTPDTIVNNDVEKSKGPIHYNNTGFDVLNPLSGTQITCIKCHESHASESPGLLNAAAGVNEVCYKCHGKDSNYSMNAANIFNKFQQSYSHNAVDAGISCTSCHGPHTVSSTAFADSTDLTLSTISDPTNTKVPWLKKEDQDITKFCLKCHRVDSGPILTKILDANTIVPFSVNMSSTEFSNGTGWNKANYTSSGHGTGGVGCEGCHDSHGSDNPSMTLFSEDGPGLPDQQSGLCLRCHGGGKLPSGKNVYSGEFDQTYRHPTLDNVTQKHSDTENYTSVSRHAECYDCHDPHTAKSTTVNQTDKLGSVSGIKFPGQQSWDNWSSANGTLVTVGSAGNNLQAYLCYKCHSNYSYSNSPPTSPGSVGSWQGTFNQTDIAKELSSGNKARHVVEGSSQMPTFVDGGDIYYYGKYANSWQATDTMKCTDCHSSSSGASKGPHGSANRFLLNAPWDDNTGKPGTESHLCFKCHDFDFYTGNDTGGTTARSQFSKQDSYNLHGSSLGTHNSAGCVQCHGSITHGWKETDLNGDGLSLVTTSEPRPYRDGAAITSINPANTLPGDWKEHGAQESCTVSCH